MSKIIKVVFTHGTGLFSRAIETVEQLGEIIDGDNDVDFLPTHCGLIVDGVFQEALDDGFIGNTIKHYDAKNVRIYDVVIDNEDDIQRGDARFKELLGTKYSYKACVAGAAYTVFGMIIPDIEGENDCSGDDTDILRHYGLDIHNKDENGEDVPASSVTPNILIGIIAKIGKQEE